MTPKPSPSPFQGSISTDIDIFVADLRILPPREVTLTVLSFREIPASEGGDGRVTTKGSGSIPRYRVRSWDDPVVLANLDLVYLSQVGQTVTASDLLRKALSANKATKLVLD